MSASLNPRFYHLTTFGCQMNEHDSERIRGVLEAEGWLPAASQEEADLLVFNTCAVRGSAESRLIGRLGEASRLKREDPQRLVALGGCFAQSKKESIFRSLPFLDVAFGPQNIAELPQLLVEAAAGRQAGCEPDGDKPEGGKHAAYFADNPSHSADLPARRSSLHHAWVQVMTGCTNFCSYCIVPYVRGPERSRPAVEIVEEVRRLASDGVVEITLLGQNVNAYGLDLTADSGAARFAALLTSLDKIEGIRRIRFTTSHPRDLHDSLIEAIGGLESVCEHLHLPVQSGSSRMLARMRRGYSRDGYLLLVEKLRARVPGLALTTDIIVGFPGEKEDDFHRTMTMVEECHFDGAFTFRFSPRAGTDAAGLPGAVPEVTIARRMRELVERTQAAGRQKNLDLIGGTQEVMVEGMSRHGGGQLRGRTRTNKIVNFTGEQAAPGALVRVKIDAATSMTLSGEAVR